MIQIGDKLKIECYKHNGYLEQTSEEATVLEIGEDYLIVANDKTKLTEHDGSSYRTTEPAVLFFYKNHWFNVIGQLKNTGLFYYCNIATPYIIDGRTIKYIDYDLDLRVYPDGSFRILDRNEYKYHKKRMHYSENLSKIIESELSKLIEIKKAGNNPFNKEVVLKYYDIFRKMNHS